MNSHNDRPVGVLDGLQRICATVFCALILFLGSNVPLAASGIEDFLGSYTGSAEVLGPDGEPSTRDLSVEIAETKKGFSVRWSSTTEKRRGRRKEKSYHVEFVHSNRRGVFSAAMQRNLFGHEVQLDPMKGEPYVWARIEGGTLTVFSMFIYENGDYEMQQYDRSLSAEGFDLDYTAHRNGALVRQIQTTLKRQ